MEVEERDKTLVNKSSKNKNEIIIIDETEKQKDVEKNKESNKAKNS